METGTTVEQLKGEVILNRVDHLIERTMEAREAAYRHEERLLGSEPSAMKDNSTCRPEPVTFVERSHDKLDSLDGLISATLGALRRINKEF